jgi:DNA-binding Xre family transcriptional regulator
VTRANIFPIPKELFALFVDFYAMSQRMEQGLWRWGQDDSSIGSLLALARRIRGLSQTELASSLKVSNANISRIEHGADLRVSTLVEIARALKMEPVLIPKEYVTAVRALLDSVSDTQNEDEPIQRPRFE